MSPVSSNTATLPPTKTSSGVPAVAFGITSPRRRSSRSEVLASCGAVVGIAKMVAISPSSLSDAGATEAMPGVSPMARSSCSSCAAVSGASLGVSTASRNGPFEPAPNAAVSWSYATRCVCDFAWLPSSGWPMRIWVTGNAKTRRTATPAPIETHGRRVTISPQRVKAGDTRTCSGFFGTSRFPKAPIMIGRMVSAERTTAAMAIAAPSPILPM